MTFSNLPYQYLAHNEDLEQVEAENPNVLDTLEHQPIAVSLVFTAVTLVAAFTLLGLFKLRMTIRLILLSMLSIVIGMLYWPHNKTVGWVAFGIAAALAGYIAYTLMAAHKQKPKQAQKSDKQNA